MFPKLLEGAQRFMSSCELAFLKVPVLQPHTRLIQQILSPSVLYDNGWPWGLLAPGVSNGKPSARLQISTLI